MKDQIVNYVRAGYPALYVVSHEEQRVETELSEVARQLEYGLYIWSVTDGIVKPHVNAQKVDQFPDTQEPSVALKQFTALPEKSILLLRDFHMFLAEPNPVLFRMLRDAIAFGKASQRHLVILGCQLKLPPELEKEITVIDFKLPSRDQLRTVLKSIEKEAGVKVADADKILDAAMGLTTIEAESAFSLAFVEAGNITPEIVAREKSYTVKKNGLLEIIETEVALADIGGLELLKSDLMEQRHLFTKEARDYGLPNPRGKLVVGQPGTGKSLTATAARSVFNLPLVRLEAGRIFGSLVGESERNWRTAFNTVKAIAPCVFWIDEVDGLFAGAESSGRTDGGTTGRVIKAILQDMQFNGDGVFFFFTANDIDGLPDPLIDRLDVWSVDLPHAGEREAIWSIHIEKRKRNAKKFDLSKLAQITDGFSGRQIEQVWLKAMTRAFNDGGREPKEVDVVEVCKGIVPTSVTMKDAIDRRRRRLENRATPASAPVGKTASSPRKLK